MATTVPQPFFFSFAGDQFLDLREKLLAVRTASRIWLGDTVPGAS